MRWPALLSFLLCACNVPAHTLSVAARREVMSTATCTNVDVEHVPWSDVAGEREDVYVAEGCGMRWRMTCGSERRRVCPRRSRKSCEDRVVWACANIQPEDAASDDELRDRVVHDDATFLLNHS